MRINKASRTFFRSTKKSIFVLRYHLLSIITLLIIIYILYFTHCIRKLSLLMLLNER